MKRQLQAHWSVESVEDMQKAFIPDLGVDWKYVSKVKWWQFWRWAQVFSEDYILSRASEIVLIRQMSDSMREAIKL